MATESPQPAGIVSPVKLTWYAGVCADCGAKIGPSPDAAQAEATAAAHEHDVLVEPVELNWQIARCGCGWEGNPTAQQGGAEGQLAYHVATAHTDPEAEA